MLTPQSNIQRIKVSRRSGFLSRSAFESLAIIGRSIRFSKAERRVLRRRKKIKPSEWAEKHRIITSGPMKGSLWRNEVTPYLAGIMNASFFWSVRTTIICSAPQIGKSALADTCLGYAMDMLPGTTLIVYPDKDTATDNSQDRIAPMFKKSARLRKLLTGKIDDIAQSRIKLIVGIIYMGWAGSATSLGNKSVKYLVLDELDKYPVTPNKAEADSISLAEKRTNAYPHDHKIWKISTPTIESGNIWQALTNEAQIIYEFMVRCPFCLEYQVMDFKNIKWPRENTKIHPDPEDLVSKKLAWYECPHCRKQWNDADRDRAVRNGYWKEKDGDRTLERSLLERRPAKIGFHIPSWLSYFVSLSKPAAAFIKGLSNKVAMRDFANNHAAEPWFDYTMNRAEELIMNLADDRPEGLVPGNGQVAALVCGADSQDNGFFYEIRAVGYGLTQETWQIRHGFVETLDALRNVVFESEFRDAEGKYYAVHLMVIDAMGHRTGEVYDFTRTMPSRIVPYKGAAGRRANPLSWSTRDSYPGTTKPIPGGVRLVTCDSHHFKDLLTSKLQVKPDDPGAWHMHKDVTMEFANHMCAEYVDDRGLWQCPKGKANHYFDCSVLAFIAAEILQIKFWSKG